MFCGAKASEVGLATTITIIMISRNAIKYNKEGTWQNGARKITTDRRCRRKKARLFCFLVLTSLDFINRIECFVNKLCPSSAPPSLIYKEGGAVRG
jgi:hypothetical protein